jgi:N-acyl-D-amino-acid deacylase
LNKNVVHADSLGQMSALAAVGGGGRTCGRAFWVLTAMVECVLFAGAAAETSLGAEIGLTEYDVVIRNGNVYDGSGGEPFRGHVVVAKDQIVGVAPEAASAPRGRTEIDARGLAVAPGFINILSWADETLLQDGRSQSNIRQGVTLEVFGEGTSMGPLNRAMKVELVKRQGDIKYAVEWSTLGEFLEFLARRGVAPNIASFVGAATLRIHELGYANRAPSPQTLGRMCDLARQAMEQGALGVSSALIYAPGYYAQTGELLALARVAGEHGGIYISHLRSEGDRFLEALEEFLTIVRGANVAGEIYHLKAAGQANWPKLERAIKRIEAARAAGLRVTADMYTYTAAATGLDAAMPPWVQEGGFEAWAARLREPAIRQRVRLEMRAKGGRWESLYRAAASPEKVLLVGFKNPALRSLTGKTLAQVAALRGKSPEETAMDLVIEDGSRVSTVYFVMSEDNVRRQLALPWVGFGSDEGSLAPEGVFLQFNPHPRAYGNFARLLGKYVREERILLLTQAIHRLTWLPASTLKLDRRGALKPGFFADLVVFDAERIQDHATFEKPHQYSTGVVHVFVNGVQVLRNGEHTGAKPGRVVRGPGWNPKLGAAPQ